MKNFCLGVRNLCQRHHTLSNLLMLVGTGLFAATLFYFLTHTGEILAWVKQNPLINPILLGALVLAEVFIVFIITRLVFTDCRAEAKAHSANYEGRRSHAIFPEATSWVDDLGVNPKRRGK